MRKVVVNSSPLISLCGISHLHLLREIYGSVMIPKAVYEEISAKHDSICRKMVDDAMAWIHVRTIENTLAKNMFQTSLHAGEVEVMVLAKECNADLVILDDALARRHAKYIGLHVAGTLGILIRARRENRISALRPLILQMQKNHVYISDTNLR